MISAVDYVSPSMIGTHENIDENMVVDRRRGMTERRFWYRWVSAPALLDETSVCNYKKTMK